MVSIKVRFNSAFNQDITQSNSIRNISNLTGIEVLKLSRVYNNTIKYPQTNGYDGLNKKIPIPAFAMVKVYDYAMRHRTK